MKLTPLLIALTALPFTGWTQSDVDFETVGQDFTWKVFGNLEDDLPDETVLWKVVDNPDTSEVNPSPKVMRFTIQSGATVFAGMFTDDLGPFIFTNDNKIVTIAVRKGFTGDFDLKWENAGGAVAEDIKVTNTVTNEWEILTFDCSILLGQLVTRMVIIPDFPQGSTRSNSGDVWFDRITFSSGEVTEPVNREFIVAGEPFSMRGVCYQPTPIGANPAFDPPFGDYYTNSYSSLYERDIPLIRAMGANTIRIYGWSDQNNHDGFLDACYNGGVDPIYVLINRYIDPNTNWSSNSAVSSISTQFAKIETRLGDHPAVIGMLIGNEANIKNGNEDDPAFWTAMNTISAAVKAVNPDRLVSVAITDAIPKIAEFDDNLPNIDFWSIQSYRGLTLGNFFNQYAAASDKPMILSEFGIDNWNAADSVPYPGDFVADTVSDLWREIEANASIIAGGCVFEFADEWWKGQGTVLQHDSGGFVQGGFPDGFSNEEWYGLFEVTPAQGGGLDTLTPRAAYTGLQTLWVGGPVGPLKITDMQPSSDALRITWRSQQGSLYDIEQSTDLNVWQVLQENVLGEGATTSLDIDLSASVSDGTFLRVKNN